MTKKLTAPLFLHHCFFSLLMLGSKLVGGRLEGVLGLSKQSSVHSGCLRIIQGFSDLSEGWQISLCVTFTGLLTLIWQVWTTDRSISTIVINGYLLPSLYIPLSSVFSPLIQGSSSPGSTPTWKSTSQRTAMQMLLPTTTPGSSSHLWMVRDTYSHSRGDLTYCNSQIVATEKSRPLFETGFYQRRTFMTDFHCFIDVFHHILARSRLFSSPIVFAC